MKIVLHLEVDEDELEQDKLTEEDKKFWLSVALSEMIDEIEDWSQAWEFEES